MEYTSAISGNVLYIYPNQDIINNRQYTVTISPGISGIIPSGTVDILETEYQFWFTSIYCPQFSTANRIKLQIGPIGDSLIDDSIWRMIHKNSIDAVDLFNINTNSNLAYDYWGCDWQDVPLNIRRYVECKTAYDILALLRISQTMGGGGGNQLKTLGDMTIKYDSGGSSVNVDPQKMKDLYLCWNESLRMFRLMKATVKGIYDQSLGWNHPAMDSINNRVIRPVILSQNRYTPGTYPYRGF